jgi:hypothetical protein
MVPDHTIAGHPSERHASIRRYVAQSTYGDSVDRSMSVSVARQPKHVSGVIRNCFDDSVLRQRKHARTDSQIPCFRKIIPCCFPARSKKFPASFSREFAQKRLKRLRNWRALLRKSANFAKNSL